MRYIVIFLLSLFILSCNNNADREDTPYSNDDNKIQSLFGSGDTIKASYEAKLTTLPAQLIIVDQNKDTNIISFNQKTATYTYTTIDPDTVVRRYKGDVKPTEPPVTPPTNPGTRSNVIFESLFNGSNPFDPAKLYKQACCSYSNTQSKTIVREGDGSFKAEVRSTDPSTSGGWRAEFIPPLNTRLVDGWYGYSIYFQDWKACSNCGEHSTQWHPDNPSGSAVLGLYTEKNTFHIRLNPEGDLTAVTIKDGKQIVSNKWYDMVWHVVWSSDKSKGRVELWIDGEKYVDYTGATLTMTGTPYFKIGIDRWNVAGVNRILYYDAVRVGNEKATYKDVAP